MGLFDQFPYTNFHELNLMWILEALKEIQTTTEQFVAINSLKYADPIQWNITSQYEKNTIVIDPQTGTAYISVEPVPIGVALTNEDYWTVVFDLGSFVTRAAKNFTIRYEEATTLTATFSINEGDWVVWGDTLYIANVNITAGDTYIEDGNITRITIEEVKNTIITLITDNIGKLEDLNTEDKENLVAAINEVVNTIGSLTSLTTEDKENLVAAINEIVNNVSIINEQIKSIGGVININVVEEGADPTGVDDSLTAFLSAINKAIELGVRVIIPSGTYLLTKPILVDSNIIATNLGSYSNYSIVTSSDTSYGYHCSEKSRQIGQLIPGYYLQSCEYVPLDNYFIFGLTDGTANGRIIVTNADYTIIRDSGNLDIGHVNDLAYNPTNRTIATCAGSYSVSNNNKIIIMSYDSLSIINTISVSGVVWEVSYDSVNRFYCAMVENSSAKQLMIFDNNLVFVKTILFEYPTTINGTFVKQGSFIKDGQFYLLYNVTDRVNNYTINSCWGMIRYNYNTGDIIDYTQYSTITMRDEVENACVTNDTITVFGGQFFFFALELFDSKLASIGVQNISTYRTLIAENTDLNNLIRIGQYTTGWGAITDTIVNRPTGITGGFDIDVTLQGVDHILQFVHQNTGPYYYREYNAPYDLWTAWKRLATLDEVPTYKLESFEYWSEDIVLNVNNPTYRFIYEYRNTYSRPPIVLVSLYSASTVTSLFDVSVRVGSKTNTQVEIIMHYSGDQTSIPRPAVSILVTGN